MNHVNAKILKLVDGSIRPQVGWLAEVPKLSPDPGKRYPAGLAFQTGAGLFNTLGYVSLKRIDRTNSHRHRVTSSAVEMYANSDKLIDAEQVGRSLQVFPSSFRFSPNCCRM